MNHEHEPQSQQAKSHQCRYLSPDGQQCQQKIESHLNNDDLCFWHNTQEIKTDPELSDKLQTLAKSGESLVGYSLKRADLTELNLVNHHSKSGYDLSHADLYHAKLRGAHLFHIDLHGASLMKADLTHANLHCANLEDCNLLGVKLNGARIENVTWGKQILQEKNAEKACREGNREEMMDCLEQAEEIYRNLRKAAENQGLFETSGYFFYKEMVMRRYQLPKFSFQRSVSKIVDWFCGYGERPLNVVLFSLLLIGLSAILYFFIGIEADQSIIQLNFSASLYTNFISFLECLYFSVVTFTTLGYGDLVPIGAARPIAALEAFTGNFTIALFVVVFVKKMTR